MKLAYNILLGVHIVAVLAVLFSLLSQLPKVEKRLLPGVIHSLWTALGAGIAMLVLNVLMHNNDSSVELLSHAKFTVKGAIIAAILYLGISSSKKGKFTSKTWATMLILTVVNVAIASSWQ